MKSGERVRLKGSGEIGVVLRAISASMLELALPSGVKTVAVGDVQPLPAEPLEALLSGAVGSAERLGLRLQALYLQHAYRFDELSGLSNARIEPQLHQVYVSHRLTNKLAPRMILADEVGLGKTIEAGIVVKELRARQLVDRILVVCPASLQLQWQHELSSKFNEDFVLMDGVAAKHFGKGGANPFRKVDNIICSLNFAAMKNRAEQIAEARWDLVIFDEAHRVRRKRVGSKVETTKTYDLADQLKDTSNGLLLLTATPMQLSPYELWSHIELVEPGLYPDYLDYEVRRKSLPKLNEAMRHLQGWMALSHVDRQAFLRSAAGELLAQIAGTEPEMLASILHDPFERERLMDALVDEHPLSRVLVRNRKVNIGGFARRRAQRIPVEITSDERDLYDAVTEYLQYGYNLAAETKNRAIGFLMVGYHKMLASSPAALHTSLERRLAKLQGQRAALDEIKARNLASQSLEVLRESPELSEALADLEDTIVDPEKLDWEIDLLRDLVEQLGEAEDAKAEALIRTVVGLLEQHPDEKLLIFTQFLETQRYLAELLAHFDIPTQVFNGSMKLEEKEEAVRRFRITDPVLISTEAGGEGRNFQFAHIVFNYDLPWNPMKVEQRIGRLDRIGQRRDVLIYNLYRVGTIEERVLRVLDERIHLFEESVGSLDPILGQIESELERLVMSHLRDLDEAFEAYATKDLDQRLREARELEHALGDFVLDRASLRHDTAAELLSENGPLARAADLHTYVARAVEHWGGTLTAQDGGDVAITIPPGLAKKLRTSGDIHIGVFDPQIALRLEDRDFLAFGHPLVDRLVALPVDDDPVSVCIQRRDDVPSGTWLEVIYEITTKGPRTTGTMLRHLVSPDARLVNETQMDQLPAVGSPVESDLDVPPWVERAVEASRALAYRTLENARLEAQEQDEVARDERLRRAERVYEHSRQRLERRIQDWTDRIAELQATGTKKQQQIIRVWQGNVEADEKRLHTLTQAYEEQIEQLKAMKSESTLQVLAASVVVGP